MDTLASVKQTVSSTLKALGWGELKIERATTGPLVDVTCHMTEGYSVEVNLTQTGEVKNLLLIGNFMDVPEFWCVNSDQHTAGQPLNNGLVLAWGIPKAA